ncbi:uncharacterized protein B0I36DRAFT_348258 [Microdochium trichocladiopsis]|uniref:Uncharacterized protein n=1 Tax=Microdochium trichocladiopsis TaxID=1682393 RepID=A0A9P9BRP8_9PEZI|nr:uncharacterized protein B0I36DRAFT_348258 [Microdochium trichocladiopsis]KAH7033161.1 hypothetical protein B0I36DRAFT_348258 [Microdochium trichocladiopsis]
MAAGSLLARIKSEASVHVAQLVQGGTESHNQYKAASVTTNGLGNSGAHAMHASTGYSGTAPIPRTPHLRPRQGHNRRAVPETPSRAVFQQATAGEKMETPGDQGEPPDALGSKLRHQRAPDGGPHQHTGSLLDSVEFHLTGTDGCSPLV